MQSDNFNRINFLINMIFSFVNFTESTFSDLTSILEFLSKPAIV